MITVTHNSTHDRIYVNGALIGQYVSATWAGNSPNLYIGNRNAGTTPADGIIDEVGIFEEVLTRWGLMSLFVWIGVLLANDPTPTVMWIAIVISGILFGLGHLPSHLALGCKKTPAFFTAVISLNLWAALIFGWLFWHYGLVSAILAHMVFHIVWLPFDLYFYRHNA